MLIYDGNVKDILPDTGAKLAPYKESYRVTVDEFNHTISEIEIAVGDRWQTIFRGPPIATSSYALKQYRDCDMQSLSATRDNKPIRSLNAVTAVGFQSGVVKYTVKLKNGEEYHG
jgi:hypothetical protein